MGYTMGFKDCVKYANMVSTYDKGKDQEYIDVLKNDGFKTQGVSNILDILKIAKHREALKSRFYSLSVGLGLSVASYKLYKQELIKTKFCDTLVMSLECIENNKVTLKSFRIDF